MSATAYPILPNGTLLFRAQTEAHTLVNDGPSIVYVSTTPNPNAASGIPVVVNGSVIWDAGRDCYAVVSSGMSTLRVVDNGGNITNPSAVASAILSQGLAQQIANAIAVTPQQNVGSVVLEMLSRNAGTVPQMFDLVYINGASVASSWTVPVGQKLVVQFGQLVTENAGTAVGTVIDVLTDENKTSVYAVLLAPASPNSSQINSYTFALGTVVIPAGHTPYFGVPTIPGVTGTGLNYRALLFGQLFPV